MKKINIAILIFLTLLLYSAEVHNMAISRLVFSSDGSKLYSASFDSTGLIWNIKKNTSYGRMRGQRGFMTCLDILENKKLILTTARDKTIGIRNRSGRLIRIVKGHSDAVNYVIAVRNIIITASDNGEVFFWKFPSMYIVKKFRFKIPGIDTMSISPDKKNIVVGAVDGKVRIIDLVKYKVLSKFIAHDSYIFSSKFINNSSFLTGSDDGFLKLWNLKNNKLIKFINFKDGVLSIELTDKQIIVGTKKGNIHFINRKNFKVNFAYKYSKRGISALAVYKNKLAAGDEFGKILIINTKNGKILKSLGR